MKNITLKTLVMLVLILSFAQIALAGSDSFSIPVSCSIPIVPGLNAPPYANDKTTKETLPAEEKKEKPAKKEKQEQIILAEERNSKGIIQTAYSR